MRDLVIVGAGAAGLMAAIAAGEEGARNALVVERSRDGGRKILISGGGRCNVLPSQLSPGQYMTESSPHSLRKLLLSWPLEEQRSYFEGPLGIPLALEAETGKLFPVSERAREVRDALVARARALGAEFHFERSVEGLVRDPDTDHWILDTTPGGPVRARTVILTTGGLSVPATGSDGTGLRLVEALGHTVHELYPALTPLVSSDAPHAELAGVSLEVTLVAPGVRGAPEARGGFLFTHRGYSGPAVLDLSHLAVRSAHQGRREALHVQWTHEDRAAWDTRLADAGQAEGASIPVSSLLRRALPQRLADRLVREAGVDGSIPLARLRKEARAALAGVLGAYPLPWTGDEGYRKAEVTGGGVSLAQVDPRSLESRVQPGLFLAGEILDAFGPIGGYNFAWAWATGRQAGRGAAAWVSRQG
ncbi:MAG: aminoacetone oxidase family FAD-binding enzyme [Gemmatimonadales bacterium]|nr:MAG: aminoacetone oxidase family FAD-binding enzyme [Gemmatimonadales bacterium]